MMTIILILCLGILLVNMYFFKAVCKSNDAINKTIDGLREKLSTAYERQTDINDVIANHTNSLKVIESKIDVTVNKINTFKVELLDAVGNDITVKLDNTYKLLSTLNIEGAYTEANKNYESLDSRMELVSSKLNKIIKEYHELVDETNKWRNNVAQELTEIYGEAVDARKAVVSLKQKSTTKSTKTSTKDSKPSK